MVAETIIIAEAIADALDDLYGFAEDDLALEWDESELDDMLSFDRYEPVL
jgi:hypothetical protein